MEEFMEKKLLGNRYELIERIGGGGMAIVYKARCTLLNRYVAIKILRDEFTNDEEFVKRFKIEAQSAARLSHPNIVSIFDVGQEGGTHYIVMEYIDGITLKEYIEENGRLDWREAVNIGIQICSALEHAHRNKIIHRDIKPHNIMLTKDGIAKVTDFGIARAVSSATITLAGSTIGSVHYFSPEQARGFITDEKSDIYSAGITLFEMVTGRVPFDGDSPVSVALQHIQNDPVRPGDIVDDIPEGLSDIIMRAVKKNKELRYQTATDLLSDLLKIEKNPDARFAHENESDGRDDFATKKMPAVWAKKNNREDDSRGYFDDDPEEERRDRLGMRLGIIAGLMIVAIFFYVGFKIFVPALASSNEFVVGDYTGKLFTDVKEELEAKGMQVEETRRVYSDIYEEGYIVSQYPEKDKTLKKGGTIKFEVSNGPELIRIPDLAFQETRVAEQRLADEDLFTEIVGEYSDTVPTGTVIRTIPAADEKVKPGTVVTIVESKGPQFAQVKVPSVIGLTRTVAEKLITGSNLKIGKITPENVVSDLAVVTKQYPSSGTMVAEGTAVELTFEVPSAGPQETSGKADGGNNGNSDSQVTGTGTGADNNKPAASTPARQTFNIILDNPDNYGDEIALYVEVTPSETNKTIVLCNKKVPKDKFPYSIEIPGTRNKTTHVIIKMDNELKAEWDMQF